MKPGSRHVTSQSLVGGHWLQVFYLGENLVQEFRSLVISDAQSRNELLDKIVGLDFPLFIISKSGLQFFDINFWRYLFYLAYSFLA